MKRKYALLALALLALSGCGSDDSGRTPTRVDGNGGDNGGSNTGQPVSQEYFSHIKDNVGDAAFTLKIKEFLAIAPDETTADSMIVGLVKANSDSNVEGMRVRLNLGLAYSAFTTLIDIDPSNMNLEILIYDAVAATEGAIRTTFPAGFGRVEQDGSDVRLIFEDDVGMVWFKGNLVNDQFVGRMYFDNTLNAYQGALGNFVFPKCVLFTNGCN
jgi:hypothetical protein